VLDAAISQAKPAILIKTIKMVPFESACVKICDWKLLKKKKLNFHAAAMDEVLI
jgi:hypothetical protein